ncbi:MAG: glutamate 5-kinase, partial [Dehalococcoidia bacterium]|nr:glutamate 5-kinase [Dehalococcoidia bacterium]
MELDKSTPVLPYHRIVVKLGTNLLTAGTGKLDLQIMAVLVSQIAALQGKGKEVTVVSSGAIAAGRKKLGLRGERKDIPFKQVLASIGQSSLMSAYEQLFDWHGITVAQALLTRADLSNRLGYLNARNTLLSLMELKVICIVNENDVVATEELRGARFGDNDNLSAQVANLVDADLLVILTDIGGLYTGDPHKNPTASLIPRVDKIDAKLFRIAGGPVKGGGTGGMVTKLEAAKLATASGVGVIIAGGRIPDVLIRIASGESIGTFFAPGSTRIESRKRWMLSGLACCGKVVIDDGAAAALRKQNKSLLPSGISTVQGEFSRGDIVEIFNGENRCIGFGISSYSSGDIQAI